MPLNKRVPSNRGHGSLQTMSRRLLTLLVLWAALCCVSTAFADQSHAGAPAPSAIDDAEYVPGAKRLEQRLLAPCCWDTSKQTLDVHDSPIAIDLRREIKRRLKAGETPDAVEADNIFSVLMGDQVAPRRDFIVNYARDVKNLDI